MLFIGIIVGAYSSIFIATPLLVSLRRSEPAVVELAKRAARYQAKRGPRAGRGGRAASADAAGARPRAPQDEPAVAVEGRGRRRTDAHRAAQVHKWARAAGPRNQPKRAPKSKR